MITYLIISSFLGLANSFDTVLSLLPFATNISNIIPQVLNSLDLLIKPFATMLPLTMTTIFSFVSFLIYSYLYWLIYGTIGLLIPFVGKRR